MANSVARRIVFAVLGTAASSIVRKRTRGALHDNWGAPRLPRPVRRQSGLLSALVMAAITGVLMALADIFNEQGKTTAQRG